MIKLTRYHMAPILPRSDKADHRRRHSKSAGNERGVFTPLQHQMDLSHVILTQLGHAMARPLRTSSLPSHVLRILRLCAEPQMRRVKARGVVAAMQDTHLGASISSKEHQHTQTMNQVRLSSESPNAIPVSVPCHLPFPTSAFCNTAMPKKLISNFIETVSRKPDSVLSRLQLTQHAPSFATAQGGYCLFPTL